MPYVKPNLRPELRSGRRKPMEAGELNYLITMEIIELYDALKEADYVVDVKPFKEKVRKLCDEYLDNHHLKYQTANDCIGALSCALYEFKDRTGGHPTVERTLLDLEATFYSEVIRPYEDKKILENQDVYRSVI